VTTAEALPWRGPVLLDVVARRLGVARDAAERALVAARWHVDPWRIAWPPGQIEAYLRTYPDRAIAREEALNIALRAVGLPETTLYRDMLKKISEGGRS
jgi:hypothetical protein